MSSTSKIATGRRTGIVASEVALFTTPTEVRADEGVQILAASTNTDTVYVGVQGVTADSDNDTDGFPLTAGQSLLIKVRNPNDLYLIADGAAGSKVWFIIS